MPQIGTQVISSAPPARTRLVVLAASVSSDIVPTERLPWLGLTLGAACVATSLTSDQAVSADKIA